MDVPRAEVKRVQAIGEYTRDKHADTRLELEAAKERIVRLTRLVKALEGLLACYRIGKRPSGKLLDTITELKQKEATDEAAD